MTTMKKVRLLKPWKFYKPGAIVGPLQPNVASTLVCRKAAEYVDDPAKARKRTRKKKSNGEIANG